MTPRYSPSTGCFYPGDVNYGSDLPADIIDILPEVYEAARARPAGTEFEINAEGTECTVLHLAPPTLSQTKSLKLAELSAAFTQSMGAVRAGYPDDEIQSWFSQKSEAVAYVADNAAATPLLSAMATARGITVADLAARIIANAMAYSIAAGTLIGKRQKYEDAVNAAVDVAGVDSVCWVD